MRTGIIRPFVTLAALAFVYSTTAMPTHAQQAPDGRWSGAIVLPGVELNIDVRFNAEAESATIDIPQQGAFGLPLQNVQVSPDSIYFELPAGLGLATFESTEVTQGRISGNFAQSGVTGTFHLEPNPEEAVAEIEHAAESPVSVEVEGGTLHGSLASPAEGSETLVILHAGSGPTTRDGNTQGMPSGNNSLWLLSDALVDHGFAVLRYDKRGIGESSGFQQSESDLRFDSFVSDLVAWIDMARQTGTWKKIVLAGHSEGALVATLAAARTNVNGLVLLAGAGRSAPAILREQLTRNLPPALYAESDSILVRLERGETSPAPSPQLAALFRESVQPYLISWFQHDPAEELGALITPAIVIQGTTDIQISVADAERLAASRDDVDLVLIEGMNHVFKDVEGDLAAQVPSYGDPHLPLNAELAPLIAAFIASL